jgi:hypothetical protein
MGVKDTDLIDLLIGTQKDLGGLEFEVTWDNQDYEFCRIYQKDRIMVDGGTSIERRIMFDDTGNASYCDLYDTDEPKTGQVLHTINVPWTILKSSYSWDKLEIIRNRGSGKKIVDLMTVKRTDGLWSLAKLIESRAWLTPTSATDNKYPYGVPYYLTFYTDTSGTVNTSDGAFNGKAIKFQDGTYSYTAAGIDASTEDKWRNYCGLYTNVDAALLKKFRKAFLLTQFKAPLFITDPASKKVSATKRIYADADTSVALQDLMDQKDDNHKPKELFGGVMVQVDGAVFINRLPVVYIPQLNGVSCSPIYVVDFNKFQPIVQDGYWIEEGEPISGGASQHTVFTTFIDGSHNNLCTNRRAAGFVMHKAS